MEEKEKNIASTEETADTEDNKTERTVTGEDMSREASEKKRNNGKNFFILILIAAAAFIFFGYGPDIQNPFARGENARQNKKPAQSIMTVEILKEKILEQQKLVTYTDMLEVSVESSLSRLNIPFTKLGVPGTTRQFRVTVPVTVDLTTDLQNMEISYNEEEDTAYLKIPEAEVFRVTPDISNMRDRQDIGFFRSKMTAEEQQAMIIEAERAARAEIYERNYIAFANQRAKTLLEEMVKRLGIKHAEVEVR